MPLTTGDAAPAFDLKNANPAVGGDTVSFSDATGENGTVVLFECNHCPYVVASVGRINAMAEHCQSKGIGFVGINSNDPAVYENDSFDHMVKQAKGGMPYAHSTTTLKRLLMPTVPSGPRVLPFQRPARTGLSGPNGRQPSRNPNDVSSADWRTPLKPC